MCVCVCEEVGWRAGKGAAAIFAETVFDSERKQFAFGGDAGAGGGGGGGGGGAGMERVLRPSLQKLIFNSEMKQFASRKRQGEKLSF